MLALLICFFYIPTPTPDRQKKPPTSGGTLGDREIKRFFLANKGFDILYLRLYSLVASIQFYLHPFLVGPGGRISRQYKNDILYRHYLIGDALSNVLRMYMNCSRLFLFLLQLRPFL